MHNSVTGLMVSAHRLPTCERQSAMELTSLQGGVRLVQAGANTNACPRCYGHLACSNQGCNDTECLNAVRTFYPSAVEGMPNSGVRARGNWPHQPHGCFDKPINGHARINTNRGSAHIGTALICKREPDIACPAGFVQSGVDLTSETKIWSITY